MNGIWHDSLPGRAVSRVRAGHRAWYEASLLFCVLSFFARHYKTSGLRRHWERFLGAGTGVRGSIYGRMLAALHGFAERAGERTLPGVRRSFIHRALCAVGRFFRRLWDGSLPGRLLGGRLTLRRLFLLAFALYLPLDYVIRNVVNVALLSSVWDELFFLGTALYVVGQRYLGRARRDGPDGAFPDSVTTPLDLAILLFGVVGFFLMCANSPVWGIAVDGYRATVQYILWFFVVIRLIRNDGDFVAFCGALAAVGVFVALHGIYQYIVAAPIPDSWVSDTEMGVRTRAFSITGSPNILGALLTLIAPVTAGFAYYAKRTWQKFAAWAAVGAMCAALLVTFSRGAWLGVSCAIVVFALLCDGRLIGLLLAGGSCALFVPSVANRILYLFTEDFATASASGGRSIRWEIGQRLLSENPLLGFGLGRFGGAVAMQNQILEVTDDFYYFYMDNYYLKIATEMGYTGLVAFLILVAALLVYGLRSVKRVRGDRLYPLGAGLLAGMTGVLVHCLSENIFEVPYMSALFWGMAAALLYLGYIRPSPGREPVKTVR